MQASEPGAPQLPFHAWGLYRMRFMMAADICDSWLPFGGVADHLDNLPIIPHLATTESIEAAIAYDTMLSAHMEDLACARAERTAGVVDFMDMLCFAHPRLKIQAIARATNNAQPPAVTKAPAEEPPCGPEGHRESDVDS